MEELKHEPPLVPPELPRFYADCGHESRYGEDEYLMMDGKWVCESCMLANRAECEDYSRRLAGFRTICGKDIPYYTLG